ncbi:uncharacterized protein LOC117650393 isoform X2 [Thrips palmi]|uniref:Uncharacterized protein LOC117650393 isoform X2 n=1 Tax=Thrips palmi TaxID=161013 RepID=A0A6P8ZWD7_THRPL|nr:uncharacterized protein LOC117650393 isoform X2 [Thrips palmi]XP_034249692.1 uncharacterized protein LOC117650393 isoform X2 [Thrips palmi]
MGEVRRWKALRRPLRRGRLQRDPQRGAPRQRLGHGPRAVRACTRSHRAAPVQRPFLQHCVAAGRGGRRHAEDHTDGYDFFPPGEKVLEAQHRPGRLAVWLQGRPDDVAEVPVEADYGTLRVRPWNWATDMPVEFNVTAGDCGASDLFKCKDGSGFIGGCVPGQRRCSGEEDCGDGSDEEGCDAHTVALPPNASVTVRVQFARLHRYVELHLCGARNCSTLMLHGERPDGTLAYEATASCNRLGRDCTNILEAHISGPHNFVFGEVVLEAQHRPGRLAVWPQGRPEDAAEVPVEADYGTLRVRPYVWSADMPVQFTGIRPPRLLPEDVDGALALSVEAAVDAGGVGLLFEERGEFGISSLLFSGTLL